MKKYFYPTLVSLILTTAIRSQSIPFIQAPGSPIANNNSQRGYASKDLNNDGLNDLIVGNAYSSSLYIYMGLGTGQFVSAPGSPVTNVNGPIYNAVADFNNDNIQDIATANYNGANISILLGTGTGSFHPASGSPIATASLPYCIEAADFNLDGNADLITTNAGGNSIMLLLGNGMGAFTMAAGFPITAGGLPYHVSSGFFNADGFRDFAVANGAGNTVDVFLGTASGAFIAAPGSPYSVGTTPRTIAVKDVNNDNNLDLIIPNFNSGDLTILLGSTSGTFADASGSPFSVGYGAYQCVIEDFDQNGSQDLAVTTDNNVFILYGNSTGSFNTGSAVALNVGTSPQPICVADFNGDNSTDLAIGDWTGNNVNVLLNDSVYCGLSANFSYTIAMSGLATFVSASTGTSTSTLYSWNFGDNSAPGSGMSVSHTYTANGVYIATLVISGSVLNSCSDTYTQTVEVVIDHPNSQRVAVSLCDEGTADTYLASGMPNVNYGNHSSLGGNTWTCSNSLCLSRALFMFNLSTIPAGAVITDASLQLFADLGWSSAPTTGGPSNSGFLSRVTAPWAENTVTWNTQPSTSAANIVSVPGSTSTTQNYTLNVTYLVQDMVNSTNYGFMLKMQDEQVYYKSLMFASSDNSVTANCPVLTITYSTATVPTGIKALGQQSEANVSPNPFTNDLTVKSTVEISKIIVLDMLGKICQSELVHAKEYALSTDLIPGIYFISIYGNNNKLIATKKLIRL